MREYSIGLPLGLDDSLPAEDFAFLRALGRPLRRERGEMVYAQGATAAHVYLLVSGRVKTVMVDAAGQAALLRLHLPGNLLGLTALASQPVRDADGIATEAAELVEIPRAAFLAALEARPGIAVRLARLLVDRLSDFHHRVGIMSGLSVEQRMAQALLSLSRPDPNGDAGGRRQVALTHEEFAQLLGARRPTVSAALTRLAGAGLIRRHRGRIEVADIEGLAALLPEGFGREP